MLRRLTPVDDDRLLVDAGTGDDAAVWKVDADRALVATVDFITPVVDDARTWGQVAAANSVSDVYAMGGRPLFALNLVGWNTSELSSDLLAEVLLGAQDVAVEGGFVIVGGHTVDDPEPKSGLAVVESGVDVTLEVDRLPVLPTTRQLIAEGVVPGGSQRNLAHVEAQLDRGSHSQDAALLVADAQTSGGLIFGVDPAVADGVVSGLADLGHTAAVVGSLTEGSGRIRLR